MSKKAQTQSLINSVRKLDKINDVDFEFKGNMKEILSDPMEWGKKQVQRAISENLDKYSEAKKLGDDYWNEVRDKS